MYRQAPRTGRNPGNLPELAERHGGRERFRNLPGSCPHRPERRASSADFVEFFTTELRNLRHPDGRLKPRRTLSHASNTHRLRVGLLRPILQFPVWFRSQSPCKPRFSLAISASPCTRWSRRNRWIVALRSLVDARGFRQWARSAAASAPGERAFYILGPCVARRKKNRADGISPLNLKVRIKCGFRP